MLLGLFRIVALIEGITTVLLFLVAMPLKYLAGQPLLVPPVGWMHGLAFIAYVVTMMLALPGRRTGVFGWLRTFAAALVPFGTFLNDRWVKQLEPRRILSAR
ncbi:hypothetical protein SCLO_1012130 [Sphingobium cloacae]|uniref:DUF3817 domain-containing protein n=2 Tax=Sphingobium cloacae TaxID=120107 RepID=A0A1E1F163_9SPHN|nr:hypothetical protein SCLO_1012130 [Sphingobium cloacae]